MISIRFCNLFAVVLDGDPMNSDIFAIPRSQNGIVCPLLIAQFLLMSWGFYLRCSKSIELIDLGKPSMSVWAKSLVQQAYTPRFHLFFFHVSFISWLLFYSLEAAKLWAAIRLASILGLSTPRLGFAGRLLLLLKRFFGSDCLCSKMSEAQVCWFIVGLIADRVIGCWSVNSGCLNGDFHHGWTLEQVLHHQPVDVQYFVRPGWRPDTFHVFCWAVRFHWSISAAQDVKNYSQRATFCTSSVSR